MNPHGNPSIDEDALMKGVIDHSAAFLASRHHLMALIVGLVRNPAVAEDLFQEVWICLDQAMKRGVVIQDTAKWCRGVARNLILHHWREQRDAKVIYSERFAELAELAFDEWERDDVWFPRRLALEECLRKLPAASRHMLNLKYEQNLDMAGVALRLSKTVAGVKMALSRLRSLLFDCVRKKMQAKEFCP